MSISRLAAAGGVGVETIRFYQRKGLLLTPASDGGVRRYGSDDLQRLRFIRQAKAAGFTLAEVAELLVLNSGEDRRRAHELASARIAALDAKIADMQVARESLARLAKACGSGGQGACPILSSFES